MVSVVLGLSVEMLGHLGVHEMKEKRPRHVIGLVKNIVEKCEAVAYTRW